MNTQRHYFVVFIMLLILSVVSIYGTASAISAPSTAFKSYPIELVLDGDVGHNLISLETPVTLTLDDGSSETSLGPPVPVGFIFLNRFTPSPGLFPFLLDQIQVYFPSADGVGVGDAIALVVYQDADGDPSNGADFLASYPTVIQTLDMWNIYDIPSLYVNGPGDILIGVITLDMPYFHYYLAALDETTSQQRSWAGFWQTLPPPDPPLLPPDLSFGLMDSLGRPGNWMIRGCGETTSITPTPTQITPELAQAIHLPISVKNYPLPTPTPSPTLTITPTKTPTHTPTPTPRHFVGTPSVSFDVFADQEVCNFKITIPFNDKTCYIHPTSCAEITDGNFRFEWYYPDFGITDYVNGTFDTPIHVSGDWSVALCASEYLITPSTGTWEANEE